MNFYRFIFIR